MTATLVCLVEGRSERQLLQNLIPRILSPEVRLRFVTFQGKADLRQRVGRRIRGWHGNGACFLVLCDQDGGDCQALKAELDEVCAQAIRQRGHTTSGVLIRIACRELECWFLGDLRAVGEAFGKPAIASQQQRAKYRDPDRQANPVAELGRLLGGYQKIDGARRMGTLLDLERNRSASFQVFRRGLLALATDLG